jgi:arginyl-tRNA synthetase
LKQKILNFLKKELELEDNLVLNKPKDSKLGDFATPVAFSLAKKLRKAPMKIADELKAKLEKSDNFSQYFSKIESLKGYLNFYLSSDFFNLELNLAFDESKNNNFGKTTENNSSQKELEEIKNKKILLEFVSANPTGPLHIGHTRGAIYGDSLLKIGRFLGYNIDAEYYINDAGRQIDLLGVSLLLGGKEQVLNIPKEKINYPEEFYRGEYILDLAVKYHEEFNNKEIFEADLSDTETVKKLAIWGKDQMMNLIKDNLASVDIVFDNFVSEKELYELWDYTHQKLDDNGTYEKDGKIWLKSTTHKDEKDRVIVRENGIPTYLAGDIIYHNNKFERDYTEYINIWGADHHGYIARVKSAIEFLNYDSKKLEVLLTQMVSLLKDGEPFKMSKRAGNFILMQDVVDEVSPDALRYTFASKNPDIPLEFDVNDLNKQDNSNPIYYINYAHARIKTMLEKSTFDQNEILNYSLNSADLEQKFIKDLIILSLQLNHTLRDAFESRATSKLTDYLHNLASTYHSFYNNQQILNTENEKLYLKISLLVAISINTGLSVLGITAKEKM